MVVCVCVCVCVCLQACLVQLGPKECLVVGPDSHSDAGRLRELLARCGLLITARKRGDSTDPLSPPFTECSTFTSRVYW